MGDVSFTPALDLDKSLLEMIGLAGTPVEVAEKIAAVARANAPRDSGKYADSIKVQKTKSGARVFASDHKAAWIEFGVPSRNRPALFVLRRAADALGLKFRKGRR